MFGIIHNSNEPTSLSERDWEWEWIQAKNKDADEKKKNGELNSNIIYVKSSMNQRPYVEIACRVRHSLSHLILLFIRQTKNHLYILFRVPFEWGTGKKWKTNGTQPSSKRFIWSWKLVRRMISNLRHCTIQLRWEKEEQIVTGFI